MDYLASKGDIITDLHEDLAADAATLQEQPQGASSSTVLRKTPPASSKAKVASPS